MASNGGNVREDIARVRQALGPRVPTRHAMYHERARNETIEALDRIGEYVLELEEQLRNIRTWADAVAEPVGDTGYGL